MLTRTTNCYLYKYKDVNADAYNPIKFYNYRNILKNNYLVNFKKLTLCSIKHRNQAPFGYHQVILLNKYY